LKQSGSCLNVIKVNVIRHGEGSTARNSSARKNCSTPKSRLLDTVRADVKKMKTAQKSKKRHFEQMRVLDQNEQLLELQLLDKSIEKCQLLEL
jgi:hypothetical protein